MTKSRFAKHIALLVALVVLITLLAPIIAACTPGGNDPSGGARQYTITFYTDIEGATASKVKPIVAEAGATITQPDNPTCPGYTFAGWYTDYGTWEDKFDSFTTMPAENINLYAKWDAISSEAKEEYEQSLDTNSKEGILYIHYMRFNSTPEEYDKYNLWVWPKNETGVTFDWVRDTGGKVVVDAYGGATCEVDLTKVYTNAGNDGNETTKFLTTAGNYKQGDVFVKENYTDDSIGFLIVDEESKNGGSHWTSDGGNQYIPKNTDAGAVFADKLRANGSVHIFATQEYVSQYEYSIMDVEEVSDPYADDDGTNVSKSNINSSAPSPYPVVPSAGNSTVGDVVEGVGYQIMVSSFADSNGDGLGDIKGITNNLDYLHDTLHVDVLWLTPIQLSDSYHGYDIIDYKQVDPKFGTLDDYKELLAETEARGMTVIMDLVLNHTSVNNVWFQKSAQLDPAYRSFYQWRNNKDVPSGSNSWHQYSDKEYSYYGKFATSMPELNYDNQATRDAVVDVANYWLALGVDGLRLDAVKHIYMADEVNAQSTDTVFYDGDYSSNVTKNLHFFREFNARVKEKYPNAYIVGENFDGNAYNVAPYYEGMDSMLDFYSYYSFAGLFSKLGSGGSYAPQRLSGYGVYGNAAKPNGANTGNLLTSTDSYYGALTTYSKYRGAQLASNSLFTSNHDVSRLLNTAGAGSGNLYINSGNAQLAIARAKVIMATMMSLPGITFIYYGDELGMSGNFENGQTGSSPHVDRQYRQPFKWEKTATAETTDFSISGDVTYYVEWDSYNVNLDGVKEQLLDPNSMLNYTRGNAPGATLYWYDSGVTLDTLPPYASVILKA